MEKLKECIEKTLEFILNSHINQTLDFDLGLSKDFCLNLLKNDPNDTVSLCSSSIATDSFLGVPEYPLFKRLSLALYKSIISGSICKAYDKIELINEDVSLMNKVEEWNKLIIEKGTELLNELNAVSCELHVQEPYFSLLKDGHKTIEGRCANTIVEPGALILINKIVALEVKDVRKYTSFLEMLKTENLFEVLPGVKTVEEGVKVYRKFYTEEKELAGGVLAICVSKVPSQPYLSLASILSGLGYSGIQSLLGIANTVGTVPDALPPSKSTLLSAFTLPYSHVGGSALTHGARALAKHSERSSDKYWGVINGNGRVIPIKICLHGKSSIT